MWDAVRAQWRGTPEEVQDGRISRQDTDYLDADEVEKQLVGIAPICKLQKKREIPNTDPQHETNTTFQTPGTRP